MELNKARKLAEQLKEALAGACERIEIAGSIRREKEIVKDIELVAMPRLHLDLLGQYNPAISQEIDSVLLGLVHRGLLRVGDKNGPKYKKFLVTTGDPNDLINLDLFLVTPPAQWGVIFLLRTGPDKWSQRCVTSRLKGGWLPTLYQVRDGAIWKGERDPYIVDTPEEKDVFELMDLPFVSPQHRERYVGLQWWKPLPEPTPRSNYGR